MDELREALLEMNGVLGVCDLHVWTVTSGMESMSAHVIVRDEDNGRGKLREIRELVHDRFGIDHVTIQLEPERFEERNTGF